MYGHGISKEGDLLDVAANEGIVEKAGSWYSYNNAKLGQGREQSKDFLKANPELMAEIRQKVFVKHGLTKNTEIVTNVDMATGEIKEEKATKPTKAKVQ
nr:DNA recombination/repair protein RecA [Bdellovibrionales bacterium]